MDNRVTVTADGQVQLTYTATNEEPRKRLYHTLTSMLGKLGMEERHLLHNAYLQNPIPVAGVAHQAGTCRFGGDPASSVLDVNCKAHELDNLYVVDTSFFPSIGAVNPALTAMANALRVGEHLLERLGARPRRARMAAEHNGRVPGSRRRRVVIVGGGFGGLAAAAHARRRRRRGDARRPPQPPPLSAPALPARVRGALAVGVRHPDPGRGPPPRQRERADGHRRRPGRRAARAVAGP